MSLGPARLHLGPAPEKGRGENELYVEPTAKEGELRYTLFYRDSQKASKSGLIKEFEKIDTGWMDIQFQVLKFLPQAKEDFQFDLMEAPTPLTTAAIVYEHHFASGEVVRRWVQQNDVVKIFSENAVYIMNFGNKKVDLARGQESDFKIRLKEFQVGRYQGTLRAASYESRVELLSTKDNQVLSEHLISMNEPLKAAGLTFYQASFQEGPDGQPIASILSVNYDPGRWLKYLGSLIMSLGIILLFYDKRKAARALGPKNQEEVLS